MLSLSSPRPLKSLMRNNMKDEIYIPIQMFVKITRNKGEFVERAMLVARRENGQEFVFTYRNQDGEIKDLIVNDFI